MSMMTMTLDEIRKAAETQGKRLLAMQYAIGEAPEYASEPAAVNLAESILNLLADEHRLLTQLLALLEGGER